MRSRKVFALLLIVSLAIPAVAAPMTIASVQMEVTEDLAVNLARILQGIDEAKTAGARVVLFPEMVLSGFSAAAIEKNREALPEAEAKIAASAKQHEVYVLYGVATESGQEKPYNSAILVGPDGEEVTRYHKMFPEGWFTPGDHLAYFEVDGVPCTMMICHDERFPELTRIPALAGAKVCFYISYEINGVAGAVRKMEGYRAQLQARAMENGIWVVQSNGIGPLGGAKSVSMGQSRVVDPGGGVVKELPALVDDMMLVTIDPEDAGRGNVRETKRQPALQAWYQSAFGLLETQRPPQSAMEKTTVRIAQMRTVPVKWDLDTNFQTFLKYLAEADEQDAEIFITPEGWLDGYAAPDKASTPERILGVAQDLQESPYVQRVAKEAKERGMWICFGFTSPQALPRAISSRQASGSGPQLPHSTNWSLRKINFGIASPPFVRNRANTSGNCSRATKRNWSSGVIVASRCSTGACRTTSPHQPSAIATTCTAFGSPFRKASACGGTYCSARPAAIFSRFSANSLCASQSSHDRPASKISRQSRVGNTGGLGISMLSFILPGYLFKHILP